MWRKKASPSLEPSQAIILAQRRRKRSYSRVADGIVVKAAAAIVNAKKGARVNLGGPDAQQSGWKQQQTVTMEPG